MAKVETGMGYRPGLYGALLAGKVYLVDCEVGLGEDGPFAELVTRTWYGEPAVLVFTRRDRMPATVDPRDVEVLPFTYLLTLVPPNASVVLDPTGDALVIGPDEVRLLRLVASDGINAA